MSDITYTKDVAIAYRVYPGISKTPAFHAQNKLELTRFCLESFRRALGNLRFKLWAILDGCPPAYGELFRSVFTAEELEIVETPAIGNLKTFARQIDLLTNQTEAPWVYFAEDDFFYRPNALVELMDFASRNCEVDFATPYDHPDSYTTSSKYERHRVTAYGQRHWRQASSTVLTFLTKQTTLVATTSMMRSYCRGNMDCSLWLALTQKTELANLRVNASDQNRLKIWAKVWIWGWKNVLFSRAYRLWSPMPSLATHLETLGLSPVADWAEEFFVAERQSSLSSPG